MIIRCLRSAGIRAEYGGEGPVLHASSVIKTKAPKDQVISFV